jgi:hypothetical protein
MTVVYLRKWLSDPISATLVPLMLPTGASIARAVGIGMNLDGPSDRARRHRVFVVVEPHQAGLASSGSCHRAKAAAFRREFELLLLPVGSLPTSVACPLRSTGITPLQHYYGAVRPSPAHQYFRPRG